MDVLKKNASKKEEEEVEKGNFPFIISCKKERTMRDNNRIGSEIFLGNLIKSGCGVLEVP